MALAVAAPPVMRSLVVAPQWIGDSVLCEPLLRRLAERGERISVGALPWVAPAFRAMACVSEVLEWPFQHGRLDLALRWRLGRSLAGRFERAYVLPNAIKAALLPAFAGIPLRIGYQGEGRAGLLNRRLPNPPGRPAMVGFYAALADLAAAGGGGSGADLTAPQAHGSLDDTPRLQASAPGLAALRARLDLPAGPYRVFAPGAEYGPAKCWPASHYAQLAQGLIERDHLPVLLLGSPREAALCEAIAQALPVGQRGACRVLAGRTTLSEAIELIGGARTVVSNDSGLMHIAAAFGVEQVALFGSTSPLHTPPLNARARVLWLKDELGLDCMPCFERQCRYGHTRCLADVAPERVAGLVQAVAGQPGADTP